MADGLQYNDIVASQQEKTPNQIASTAQAATLPAISSQTLAPQQQATLPPMPPPPDSSGYAAGLDANAKTIDSTIASLTPAPTQADQTNQSILDSIASLTGQNTGKSAYQIQQENQNGLPDAARQ